MSEYLLHAAIAAATVDAESVFDVGAGTRRLQVHFSRSVRTILSLDAYAGDLMQRVPRAGSNAGDIRILGLAEEVLPYIIDDSVDVVMACDFIEHNTVERAHNLIGLMQGIARKRVCLFVPEGIHEQDGTEENPMQAHLSAWRAEAFIALGFTVEVWSNFHSSEGKPSGAIWATWEKA